MAKRPSVQQKKKELDEAMRETAESGNLEAFRKILRAYQVEAGTASEALAVQAWNEKRDEILRRRREDRLRSS